MALGEVDRGIPPIMTVPVWAFRPLPESWEYTDEVRRVCSLRLMLMVLKEKGRVDDLRQEKNGG